MSKKLNPLLEKLLLSKREQLSVPARPLADTARRTLGIFMAGFVANLVVVLAVIGAFSLLRPTPQPASSPVPTVTVSVPAPVINSSSNGLIQEPATSPTPTAAAPQPTATAPAPSPTASVPAPAPPASAPAPAQQASVPAPTAPAPAPAIQPRVPPPGATAPAAPPRPYRVFLDGRDTGIDVVMRGKVAYVPIEAMAMSAQVAVAVDPATGQVKLNGQPLAGPLVESEGQTLGRVSAVAQALNRTLKWSPKARMVNFVGQRPPVPVVMTPPARPLAPPPAPMPLPPATLPPGPPMSLPPASMPKLTPAVPPFPESAPNAPPLFNPRAAAPESFRPSVAGNGDMELTVTQIDMVSSFREMYQPAAGHQYAVVYVSLKNISRALQMTQGTYQLQAGGQSFNSLDELSTLGPTVMRPLSIHFGYLVFEVPVGTRPSSLVYNQQGRQPLQAHFDR